MQCLLLEVRRFAPLNSILRTLRPERAIATSRPDGYNFARCTSRDQ